MGKDCEYEGRCETCSEYSGCSRYERIERERATKEMHDAFRQTRILMGGTS